jgi:hypothetical protein
MGTQPQAPKVGEGFAGASFSLYHIFCLKLITSATACPISSPASQDLNYLIAWHKRAPSVAKSFVRIFLYHCHLILIMPRRTHRYHQLYHYLFPPLACMILLAENGDNLMNIKLVEPEDL